MNENHFQSQPPATQAQNLNSLLLKQNSRLISNLMNQKDLVRNNNSSIMPQNTP